MDQPQVNASELVSESRKNKVDPSVELNPNPKSNRRKLKYRPLKRVPRRAQGGRPQNSRRPAQKPTQAPTQRRRVVIKKSLGTRKTQPVRLLVRNLSDKVTNSDLKEMFQKIGPLKRCGIIWNSLGESTGRADIQFEYDEDAKRAQKKYDNKYVKNVPIRIELKGKIRKSATSNSAPKRGAGAARKSRTIQRRRSQRERNQSSRVAVSHRRRRETGRRGGRVPRRGRGRVYNKF